MSRIQQVAPKTATGKAKELLDAVKSKMGMVPNMTRAMANSPAVLNAYLQFSGALATGTLPVRNREQIALTIGHANGCNYCLAAHSAIGKMVGLTAEQILDSRRGNAIDAKSDVILKFSRKVLETKGHVSNEDVAAVREAGLNDGEIAETVANVALNIFTNYFNHVADTTVDFPLAPTL